MDRYVTELTFAKFVKVMGAGASTSSTSTTGAAPYTTQEDALADGKTQEEVDAWLTSNASTGIPVPVDVPVEATENTTTAEKVTATTTAVTASPFVVGARVRSRFAGKGHFYPANISEINDDGTFKLKYLDGDWEDDAKEEHMELIETKKKKKKPNSTDAVASTTANGAEIAAPYPCEYQPRPTPVVPAGSLVWITGPTGSGKTTVATVLKQTGNFINYEGDCFMFHLNPYTDTVPNGAGTGGGTPLAPERLKSIPQDRIVACDDALKQGFMKVVLGAKVDFVIWETFYTQMCADIVKERQRFGPGWHFVVSQAVYTRAARDLIRRLLVDVNFVVLEIDTELQSKRLAARFGMSESAADNMKKHCQGFERKEENETNTIGLTVEKNKTPEQMATEVLLFLNVDKGTEMENENAKEEQCETGDAI